MIDEAHPLGVAAGEVVVDRDDVHAAPGQRVEIDRQRRHQGLALAGLHLRDVALVQEHAAHQLDVERAQAQRPARRLAGVGEGLGQQVVQRLALGQAVAELDGLVADAGVVERLELRLQRVDRLDRLRVALTFRSFGVPNTFFAIVPSPIIEPSSSNPCGPQMPASRPAPLRNPPICHDGGACSCPPNGLKHPRGAGSPASAG